MLFQKTMMVMILMTSYSLMAPNWCFRSCGFSVDVLFFFTFRYNENKQEKGVQNEIVINLSGKQLKTLSNKAMIKYSSKIEKLDLSCNTLVKLPRLIGLFPRLKELDLSHNNFINLPLWLGECKRLQSLDISFNNFKNIPDILGVLVSFKRFKTLIIDQTLFDLLKDSLENIVSNGTTLVVFGNDGATAVRYTPRSDPWPISSQLMSDETLSMADSLDSSFEGEIEYIDLRTPVGSAVGTSLRSRGSVNFLELLGCEEGDAIALDSL